MNSDAEEVLPPDGPGWYAVFPAVGGAVNLVEVTETPSSGRICRALRQGGHALCGFQSWSGRYVPVSAMGLSVEALEEYVLVHARYAESYDAMTFTFNNNGGAIPFIDDISIDRGRGWLLEHKLKKIDEAVKARLSDMIGRVRTEKAVTEFTDLLTCATVCPEDAKHICFEAGSTPDTITPSNLYTALRLWLGANAPSWEQCCNGEYTLPEGIVVRWKPGSLYLTLPRGVEIVDTRFVLEP